MAIKYCTSCGKEMDMAANFCPECGAKQGQTYRNDVPFQFTNESSKEEQKNEYVSTNNEDASTNKILSIIALVMSIVGIFWGGLFMQIAAIIMSAVVLHSKDRCEKQAKIFAKVALGIAIAYLVVILISVIFMGSFLVNFLSPMEDFMDWSL